MKMFLRDLGEMQLASLEFSCRTLPLAYSKSTRYRKIVNSLVKEFGPKYEPEVWLIVTLGVKTIARNGSACRLTSNKNNYTKARKEGFNFSYTRTFQLIEKMSSQGYVKYYTGHHSKFITSVFKSSNQKSSMTGILKFLPKFMSKIPNSVIDKEPYVDRDFRLIVNRDPVTKERKGLQGFRNLREKESLVGNYNKLLSSMDIKIYGCPCYVVYCRVYSGNDTSGGRFYSGSFQTVRSTHRGHITINNTPLVEVDIAGTHSALLACIEGVVLPQGHKPYACYLGLGQDNASLRALFKKAFMVLLYEERNLTLSTLIHIVMDDMKKGKCYYEVSKYGGVSGFCQEIMRRLIEHNSSISSRFYNKDLWKTLQNMDSEICAKVIEVFTNQGKPVLSYHDSWMVCKEDVNLLEKTVRGAWKEVTGTSDNLHLSHK